MHHLTCRAVFAAFIACATNTGAYAQTTPAQYPQRTVKFILPFGPGSGTDIAARLFAEKLQTKWGKAIVVEPRPGGDGLIAIRAFLSANDDHTLYYAPTSAFIVHPYTLQTRPPYEAERDLLPIARTTESALSIAVSAASGVSTLKEFVALARANPGKLNVAGGQGLAELSLRAFVKEQNLDVTVVPYRDIGQAGPDLAENRIQLLSSSLIVPLPHAQAGRAKIAAISGSRRAQLLPDVPTAIEAGFPTIGYDSTVGFYGPASMALALRQSIAADILEVLRDPVVTKRLEDSGQAVTPDGPEAFGAIVRAQIAASARNAQTLGMKPKE